MVQWDTKYKPENFQDMGHCVIQYPTNRKPAQSLQENAITVFGPRLYNSLPKYLRDIESVKTKKKIKSQLDKFLEDIPDDPKMPNYVTGAGSNSFLDHLIRSRPFDKALSSDGSRNIPRWWSPRLGHRALLAASKPLQVSSMGKKRVIICIANLLPKRTRRTHGYRQLLCFDKHELYAQSQRNTR